MALQQPGESPGRIVVGVILGPTASGKSGLALELARRNRRIEIVSADSRQLYSGLDIGTATPSKAEQREICHHLIDIVAPDVNFTAGDYARAARTLIEEITRRGSVPLVVGGSGFYVQALFEGLAAPPADPGVYARLNERLWREGALALWQDLHNRDPEAASRHSPNNVEKTMRALACIEQTGRRYSEFDSESTADDWPFRPHYVALELPREQLYERINRRVGQMLAMGLEAETRQALRQGYHRSSPGLRTVGYAEMIAWIEGEITYEQMVELIARSTRRYAKRQMTWLRRMTSIEWIDATGSREEMIARAEGLLEEALG